MLSSSLKSDFLVAVVSIESSGENLNKIIDFINEFPEGSARRLEMEAEIFRFLAEHSERLASIVRETGRLTVHDTDG